VPDSLSFRHEAGAIGHGTAAAHSLGVALTDNKVEWLIAKGVELPTVSRRAALVTTVELNRSSGAGVLRVPIVQGERRRADRNATVGELELRPREIEHDLRWGSEVEVTLMMDSSQQITGTAYVPALDREYPITIDLGRDARASAELPREAAALAERHRELRDRTLEVGSEPAARLLERIAEEDAIRVVQNLAAAARTDPDAVQTVRARIRDTHAMLDDVEDQLELPTRTTAFREQVDRLRDRLERRGDAQERQSLETIAAAGEVAIRGQDAPMLAVQHDALVELVTRHLMRTGQYDANWFEIMQEVLRTDPDRVIQELLRRGRSAKARDDRAELHAVVQQLARLRPAAAGRDEGVIDMGRSTVEREF
jgi:molecular chaperone DnaK